MIDLRKVAAHYGGTGSGNQCNIPTPGHSKRDLGTSITIKASAPDGVLVKCHNGSDADALAVKDMLRRDGFLPERASHNDNRTWRAPVVAAPRAAEQHAVRLAPEQRIVATYLFEDQDGRLLYRKHRIEPGEEGRNKTFRFDRPNDTGGWLPGAGDDPVPYRLPDLSAAPKDVPLFMAEGESKADKLASWGFLATSHKDWKGYHFSGYVHGRTVFILPDNDPTGGEQAARAKDAIETAGGTVHVIELPGLGHGEDIIDWTGTADNLRALADKALGTDALPLPTLDLAELAKTRAKPKLFAIERMAPLGEVTKFTGPGSAGKSLLGQQLATASAAATGQCLGLSVQPGPAIYLTCEDDAEQLHWRQERLCAALSVDMASLAGKLHLVSLRGELGNELATFGSDGRMTPSAAFHRLSAMLRETGAKLAFLDNVAHLFAGNENDRGEVTRFINLLNKLAGETGAAIVLLGHPNKNGDDWSGSTAWPNSVRSHAHIEHDVETDIRTLRLPKSNYGQKGNLVQFHWVDGAFVRDEDLPPDTRKELAETIMASADNRLFLACLAERNKQRRHVSEKPTAQNYAPKIFATMPESKGIGRKRLTDAMDRLFRIEQIERGFIYRDTAEGKDIHGLRETSGESREGSGNLSGNLPETPSGNLRKPAENDRKHTPLDTTYQSGAASWPAAPDDDDLDWGEEAAE